MFDIQVDFCDDRYFKNITEFLSINKSKFIEQSNDEYEKVFSKIPNINTSYLNYDLIEKHLLFLSSRYTFLKKIDVKNFDIKCVINKMGKNSEIKNHKDGTLYTHIIYLNDDFLGGKTEYYKKENENPFLIIQPIKNLAVLSSNEYIHHVTPVTNGERYTLTTFIRNKHKNIKSKTTPTNKLI